MVSVTGFARSDFATSRLAINLYPLHGHVFASMPRADRMQQASSILQQNPLRLVSEAREHQSGGSNFWCDVARCRITSISHGLNNLALSAADGAGISLGDFSSGKGGAGTSPEILFVYIPPVRIFSSSASSRLSLGDEHGAALTQTGQVHTFGDDRSGAVSSGSGSSGLPSVAFGLAGILANSVATGSSHTVVVLRNGTLRVFGSNRNG